MSFRLAMIAVMAALVLAGCGRRGGLEPPVGAENVRSVPSPGRFPKDDTPVEEEPFVLDKLL